MFITKFKNRLRDCCSPRWFSHLAKGERFDLYSSFKNILEHERYLEFIQSRLYKTALARFRMGVPRINGHRYRFSVAENRLCPFCIDTIEDECHVLFLCLVYSQFRRTHARTHAQSPTAYTQLVCVRGGDPHVELNPGREGERRVGIKQVVRFRTEHPTGLPVQHGNFALHRDLQQNANLQR